MMSCAGVFGAMVVAGLAAGAAGSAIEPPPESALRPFKAAPGDLAAVRTLIAPWAAKLDGAAADPAFAKATEEALDVAHGLVLAETE